MHPPKKPFIHDRGYEQDTKFHVYSDTIIRFRPGTVYEMSHPLLRSAYHAFAAPFALGLILFSVLAFVFSQYSNGIGGLIVSFIIIPAVIGLPWGLFTFLVSFIIAFIFSVWKPSKVAHAVMVGTSIALLIASLGMILVLREQENCDSVCLGLDQPILGLIPLYVLIVVFLAAIGGVQGSIIHRLE